MKKLFLMILVIFLCGCEDNDQNSTSNNSNEAIEITNILSCREFERVKNFILNNGDQESYSNLYNNNPHFAFGEFHAYLNPETQRNSNCDPSLSDFNELVIQDLDNDIKYFHIKIIRKGDLQKNYIFYTVPDWAEEERVYLLNPYEDEIADLKDGVMWYLYVIKAYSFLS